RSCTRLVKSQPFGREPTESDRVERLLELLKDYTSVGFAGIIDRDCPAGDVTRYQKLHEAGKLPLRIAISHSVATSASTESIQAAIRKVAAHPLCKPDPRLRIVGIKNYLDGRMLTRRAYIRE